MYHRFGQTYIDWYALLALGTSKISNSVSKSQKLETQYFIWLIPNSWNTLYITLTLTAVEILNFQEVDRLRCQVKKTEAVDAIVCIVIVTNFFLISYKILARISNEKYPGQRYINFSTFLVIFCPCCTLEQIPGICTILSFAQILKVRCFTGWLRLAPLYPFASRSSLNIVKVCCHCRFHTTVNVWNCSLFISGIVCSTVNLLQGEIGTDVFSY